VKSSIIGSRWHEFVGRCNKVLESIDELHEAEALFVTDLRDRLVLYQSQTYVSAKQLNWLLSIEGKLEQGRFG
jgi:hypothetical protein